MNTLDWDPVKCIIKVELLIFECVFMRKISWNIRKSFSKHDERFDKIHPAIEGFHEKVGSFIEVLEKCKPPAL